MPTLPAPLARSAERWFGRPATVTTVDELSPGLRRITFDGEALRSKRWSPGTEIEFRVADREFRHYTPMTFDAGTCAFDVMFCGHSDGPGTTWAWALRPGDEVGVMGPAGGLRGRDAPRRLLLGDATALGLFAALLAAGDVATSGAVEVPASDLAAAASLVPGLDVVPARAEPGAALHDWLAAGLPEQGRADPVEGAHAYLVGHAQSIQSLRNRLRDRGLSRQAITTKPYWATGRRGL